MLHVTCYRNRGFTLIELLVAMAIFSVVIAAATSIFVSVLQGQRKVLAIQNTQENARYIMETIAKEIRMMVKVEKDLSPEELHILQPAHGLVEYKFESGEIKRNSQALNSSQVEITGGFYVLGDGESKQTRIIILLKAKARGLKPEQQTELNLQTTVSRRSL